MSSISIAGDTSGSITLAAPAVAGTTTLTLPATTATIATNVNGNLYPLVSGTAVASTSGTSIDFTGIPSWVKRVTVMFSGVSTNGTSNPLVQLGSGSITASGYLAGSVETSSRQTYTTGFGIFSGATANLLYGHMQLTLLSGNTWIASHAIYLNQTLAYTCVGGGNVTLSGVLDRVRITTVNGTDTFDAGSINILYE